MALATVRVAPSSRADNRSADRVRLGGHNESRLRGVMSLVPVALCEPFLKWSFNCILSSEIG